MSGPHFSSGIVERAKRERAWESPHASRLSRVRFRSLSYPWGKMGTTRSLILNTTLLFILLKVLKNISLTIPLQLKTFNKATGYCLFQFQQQKPRLPKSLFNFVVPFLMHVSSYAKFIHPSIPPFTVQAAQPQISPNSHWTTHLPTHTPTSLLTHWSPFYVLVKVNSSVKPFTPFTILFLACIDSLIPFLSEVSWLGEAKKGIPTDDELEDLSVEIPDHWKTLGRRLTFDNAELEAFDKDNDKTADKAYAMLIAWKQREGLAATYRVLNKALCDIRVRRRDLAQRFCCNWLIRFLPFSLHGIDNNLLFTCNRLNIFFFYVSVQSTGYRIYVVAGYIFCGLILSLV